LFVASWQDPEQEEDDPVYDLVVIGAGAGGLISASSGASVGGKVAMIEEHMLGGDWYVVWSFII
jgi:ribulose 1,5-bisphosphate synthetase/thiazole synthase